MATGLIAGIAGAVFLLRGDPAPGGKATIDGLSGPVSITRDRNGVPHISADNRYDVLAGLGFAHAQDRAWQLELSRRAGRGQLSEIFGARSLQQDIFLRTIGLDRAAKAALTHLSPEARRALDSYTAGVNAWLFKKQDRFFAAHLPIEFLIFGVEPAPWTPVDSIVVVKLMGLSLSGNINQEILRLGMARLGLNPAEIMDLLPPNPGDSQPLLPDLRTLLALPDGPLPPKPDEEQDIEQTEKGASNNWVIDGARTESGKPLLANDPHLGLSAPSLWYLAHLHEKEKDRHLIGATLVGLPVMVLGHNRDVAWGFTNVGADIQDIYLEQRDPANPARYLAPGGWQDFKQTPEEIIVKGSDPVTFIREESRHGPILPEFYRQLGRLVGPGFAPALAWQVLADRDRTLNLANSLWDVKTIEAYKQAMRDFSGPSQAMVVADQSGSIGMIAPGQTPQRARDNLIRGRAPNPGWMNSYDWTGVIAFDELPSIADPEEKAIATANVRITPDKAAYHLTHDWEEPWRMQRLQELILKRSAKHSPRSSAAAQMDSYSAAYLSLRDKMLEMVAGRIDPALETRLRDWGGTMAKTAPEPLIMTAWHRHALDRLLRDDLGDIFPDYWQPRVLTGLRLLEEKTARNWCDDRRTAGEENCSDQLVAALDAALLDLEARYGSSWQDWQWGEAHAARGLHVPLSFIPVIGDLFTVEQPVAGGPFALNRARSRFSDENDPYQTYNGTSFRAIYDFADLDSSGFIHSTGQSGWFLSPLYDNFAHLWATGGLITISSKPEDYQPGALGSWQLSP